MMSVQVGRRGWRRSRFKEPRMQRAVRLESSGDQTGKKPGIRKCLKEGNSGKYREVVKRPSGADQIVRLEQWQAVACKGVANR